MNSTSYLFRLLILLLIVAVVPPASGQDSPIRALLITGGGWHDYAMQKELLTEGVKERLGDGIEWTVVHEGEGNPGHQVSVLKQENWAERYDVVVHNTGYARVRDPGFVAQLVKHHKGTPAVLIHAAVQSYRFAEPADPWFRFVGLQSMVSEDPGRVEVENVDQSHPVMRDVPERFLMPEDEVYVTEKIWGEITLLARAYGEEIQEYQPVAWTHEADSTRVFATTLGHSNKTFEQEEFLTMVTNGILWAVGRR